MTEYVEGDVYQSKASEPNCQSRSSSSVDAVGRKANNGPSNITGKDDHHQRSGSSHSTTSSNKKKREAITV